MMFPPLQNTIQEPEDYHLLQAIQALLQSGYAFYDKATIYACSGNDKRLFIALAQLHQHTFYLIPGIPSNNATIDNAVLFKTIQWYRTTQPSFLSSGENSITRLNRQLAFQLQIQKSVIKQLRIQRNVVTLVNFTASLQIITDQLKNMPSIV